MAWSPLALLVSAMLAGWLMARGAWLIVGTSDTTGQTLAVCIVTFLIGIGGPHHSIADAVEMFSALLIGHEFTAFSGPDKTKRSEFRSTMRLPAILATSPRMCDTR